METSVGRRGWVLFPCGIAPGAFSGQRLITLELGADTTTFVAPIDYVFDERKKPLTYEDLKTRSGWIKGKLVDETEDSFFALMPVNHAVRLPKARAEVTSASA